MSQTGSRFGPSRGLLASSDRSATREMTTELKWLSGVLGNACDPPGLYARFAPAVDELRDELVLGPVHARLTRTSPEGGRRAQRDDRRPGSGPVPRALPVSVRLVAGPPLTVARLPGRLRYRQCPFELGGDGVEVPPEGVDRLGREQNLQPGASGPYGVSQDARASPAGVIRGGRLESGQPILERGYLARPNGPTASGLVRRFRQP